MIFDGGGGGVRTPCPPLDPPMYVTKSVKFSLIGIVKHLRVLLEKKQTRRYSQKLQKYFL